jgi:hypothetical protein
MKSIYIVCTIMWAGLSLTLADEPVATANSVALDTVKQYKAALDQVITAAIENGTSAIQAGDVATLRAMEYELLGYARLGAIKRAQLPALVFGEGNPPVKDQIPGRAIELRLIKLAVNPWNDGMTNRTFEFHAEAHDGEGDSVTFVVPVPTNTYPTLNDFQAEYAYGMDLIRRREWVDAAKHLEAAAVVPGGTTTGEWEFEVSVSAAWAKILNGDFPGAKATLQNALARPHRCEVQPRGRFLVRLLGIENDYLTPEVEAALPERK